MNMKDFNDICQEKYNQGYNAGESKQSDIEKNHFTLCNKLHQNMDKLPPFIKDDIWDLVYNYFKP